MKHPPIGYLVAAVSGCVQRRAHLVFLMEGVVTTLMVLTNYFYALSFSAARNVVILIRICDRTPLAAER